MLLFGGLICGFFSFLFKKKKTNRKGCKYLTASHCSAGAQELVRDCGRRIFFCSLLTRGKFHYTKSQKFLETESKGNCLEKAVRERMCVVCIFRKQTNLVPLSAQGFIHCSGKLCLCHALPSSHHLASSPWANSTASFGKSVHDLYREKLLQFSSRELSIEKISGNTTKHLKPISVVCLNTSLRNKNKKPFCSLLLQASLYLHHRSLQ